MLLARPYASRRKEEDTTLKDEEKVKHDLDPKFVEFIAQLECMAALINSVTVQSLNED